MATIVKINSTESNDDLLTAIRQNSNYGYSTYNNLYFHFPARILYSNCAKSFFFFFDSWRHSKRPINCKLWNRGQLLNWTFEQILLGILKFSYVIGLCSLEEHIATSTCRKWAKRVAAMVFYRQRSRVLSVIKFKNTNNCPKPKNRRR